MTLIEDVTKEEQIEELIAVLENDFNASNYHIALELATSYGMEHGRNFVDYAKRIIATKPKWWERNGRGISLGEK